MFVTFGVCDAILSIAIKKKKREGWDLLNWNLYFLNNKLAKKKKKKNGKNL